MEKYQIKLSKEAKNDLKSIKKYIKHTLLEPNIAEKYSNLICSEIQKHLEYSPEKFKLVDTNIVKYDNIRILIVKNYLAFYRIHSGKKLVTVERILYGGTNWKSIL